MGVKKIKNITKKKNDKKIKIIKIIILNLKK